jgi:hypothetical protein
MKRALGVLLALAVMLSAVPALGPAPARGGGPPSVQGTGQAAGVPFSEARHAWVIVPRIDRKESVIFHVPPRAGPAGARPGVAYIAERLIGVPDRVASWGTRAFIVTDPEAVGTSRHRRVYTINARYEGAWGWSYQPEGRLGVLPSLPAEGELVSLVADREGVTALLWTPTPTGQGGWSALRLDGIGAEAWTPVGAPWDGVAGEVPLRGAAAMVLLDERPAMVVLHPRGTAGAALEVWRRDDAGWTRAKEPERRDGVVLSWMPDSDGLIGLDGRVLEVVRGADASGPGVVVHEVWPTARKGLAQAATDPDQPGAAVGFGALDRGVLAIMWRSSESAGSRGGGGGGPPGMPGAGLVAAREDTARFKIAEVSTRTGRVLVSGPVHQPTPLADRPLHVIALSTAGFMAGLLVYTLRKGERKELPPPFRPGGLVRRGVASAADLAIGVALAGALWGVTPAELFTVQTLLGSVADAAPLWSALGLSALHSAVVEIAVGGSIGKVVVGCRVGEVAAEEGQPERIRRAQPGAVVVRNLVKWALLPATILALIDPLRRHAADVVAGTVVVDLPDEPSAPEPVDG